MALMKEGCGSAPIILAIALLSFVVMLVVEGLLTRLLLNGKRVGKEVGDTERQKEHTTKELGEEQARALPESVPSVTEHTTRAFEPTYSERKSK